MSYYDMDLPSRPVEDCISVITSAADNLLTSDPTQPPDYIGYTTILCIHLQLAASSYSDEHQDRILKALLTVLLECPEAIEHIGWDLVGPLQDFVEFEPKTQDGGPQKWGTLGIIYDLLGKYGNAQEVWLKIGEAMSNITFDDHNIGQPAIEGDDPSTTDDDDSATTWLMGKTAARKKFALLMRLAGAAYPRIKARKPSRFLADLLPLILRAYRLTASHCSGSEMLQVTQTVHDFVACLEPGQPKPKPPLPPRAESSYIAAATEQPSQHALTDLIGETETLSTTPSVPSNPSDAVADQRPPPSIDTEGKVQIKLVQAFLTYISEEYMNALGVGWEMTGIVGLCLAARFHDLIFPEKLVPGRETVTDAYQRVQMLKDRESGMSLIEQMRLRLNLEVEALLDVWTRTPEGDDSENLTVAKADMMQQEPKDSPDDPSEITFSTIGCLHLLAFRLVWPLIHGAPSHVHQPAISICDHVRLWHTLKQLGDDGEEVGGDDPAMQDAFVSLGLLAFCKYSGAVPQANEPDCNGDSAEAIRKSLVPGYFRTLAEIGSGGPPQVFSSAALALVSALLHFADMDVTVGFFNWALGHATVNIAAVGWMKDILLDSNSKRPHDEGGSRKPLDPARLQLRRKCGDLWRSRLLGSFASVRDSTLSPEAVRLFALRHSELWTATASLIYVLAKAGEWTGLLPAPVPAQGEKTTEQLYIDQRIHLLDSATEYILSEDGSSVSQSSSDPDGEKELLSLEVCRMMLTKAKAAVDFEAFGTMDRDAGSGSSTNAAEVPR